MSIIAKRIRPGIFFDKVLFQATETEEATFGTVFGDKTFYLEKDECVTLRMSKNEMWEAGDQALSLGHLITNTNQNNFNWYWA